MQIDVDFPIYDEFGNRIVKCYFCGYVGKDFEFVSYGGRGHVNCGICRKCSYTVPFEFQKNLIEQL